MFYIRAISLEKIFEAKALGGFSLKMETLQSLVDKKPLFPGNENITLSFLDFFYSSLRSFLIDQDREIGIKNFLEEKFKGMIHIGSVYFHLAENKADQDKPFAFLVTFSSNLSENSIKHLPLSVALQKFSSNKNVLENILKPIYHISKESVLIRTLLENQNIFKTNFCSPQFAVDFLKESELYQKYGVSLRIPEWWNKKTQTLKVQVTVDSEIKENTLNLHSLLSFNIKAALDGRALSEEDWSKIQESDEELVNLNGKWIYVDKKNYEQIIAKCNAVIQHMEVYGSSFVEGMRLLAKSAVKENESICEEKLVEIEAGESFSRLMKKLLNPELDFDLKSILNSQLNAELRPYQCVGVAWLYSLYQYQYGGCLADDMGLGKTIQIISLLLLIREKQKNAKILLVIPTSLIYNWESEIKKFAPSIQFTIFHSYNKEYHTLNLKSIDHSDVVITTYGSIGKNQFLLEYSWETVILDEAQAIKNYESQQAKTMRSLFAKSYFVMTGTPVENKLLDLWSLLSFCCKGLLGSKTEFQKYTNRLLASKESDFSPLRKLTKPFILRRLKSDKSIIKDLPEKIEKKIVCLMNKEQIILYKKAVQDLAKEIDNSELTPIQRKGLVLKYLSYLKQICNHPAQFLKDGNYDINRSGKLAEVISLSRQIKQVGEKVLIFTQYIEMIDIIRFHLQHVFASDGYILHGSLNAKERQNVVNGFKADENSTFFILSLKAGGTGLNLTDANHVIHFDRWWNPAIENQATDRAYRIGQTKNVLVHKLIGKGTIEEKIDRLLNEKIDLIDKVTNQEFDTNVTEFDDKSLLDFISLEE